MGLNEQKIFVRLPQDAISMGNAVISVAKRKTEKGYFLMRKGEIFKIAANKSKLITYIALHKSYFKTPEGVELEDPIQKVLEISNSEIINKSKLFQIIKLPSGWYVEIANDRVRRIFKSKYIEQ